MKIIVKLLFLGIFVLFSLATNAQDIVVKNNTPNYLNFENGESQIVPEFTNAKEWIKEEMWVKTDYDTDQDGKLDRMHVWVTRPLQTESENIKLPVILVASPYFGGVAQPKREYFWDVQHEIGEHAKPHEHAMVKRGKKRPYMSSLYDKTWIPKGYVMVYSSAAGTGHSDGVLEVGGKMEIMAPKSVIEWLTGDRLAYTTRDGQEEVKAHWSTGKIGMTGTSYDGTMCVAAASTGVKGLEAIIPVAPNTSYYRYYRSNGLVRSPGGYLGEDVDVLYDVINTGDSQKKLEHSKLYRDSFLMTNIDRLTGDYNDFWKEIDYLNKLDSMKCAMLMSHGFNDWNVMPEHSYLVYKKAKEIGLPVQLYYHQQGHGGNPPMSVMNRWFTKYLHGVDNQIELDPKVLIVRENETLPTAYEDYPDPQTEYVRLFPFSENSNQGHLRLSSPTMNTEGRLIDDATISGTQLVVDSLSKNRLLYRTPIFNQDVRISGVAKVTIRMSSSKPAANLSVWLVSLPWNKNAKKSEVYENIITRGWADPQNQESVNFSKPLIPGEFYNISFDLQPDDQVIPAGQQIGFMIFSSDKDFTLHPEPGTVLTVDQSGTFLDIPIVGGTSAYKHATEKE